MDTYVLNYQIEVPEDTYVEPLSDSITVIVESMGGSCVGNITPAPTNKYKEFWKLVKDAFFVLRYGVK